MNALARGALAALRWLMVICIGAMVVLVFSNVVLRYGFNSGISISEEASRYFFVWLTFMGAVVVMHDHGHIGVDTLVSRLPVAARKGCAVVSDLLMLGCCGLLLIGSWKQTVFNMGNAAPVSGIPVGVMHAAAFASSIGLIIVIAAHLIRVLTGRATEHELVQVTSNEDLIAEGGPIEVRK